MGIITREIINPNTRFYFPTENDSVTPQKTYQEFVESVEHWKIFLAERCGAQPGQTCLINMGTTDFWYNTCVFAAFEMGLVLVVDIPHCWREEDIYSHAVNLHGKIDIIIQEDRLLDPELSEHPWDIRRDEHLSDNRVKLSQFHSYQVQDHDLFGSIAKKYFCCPDGHAIYSSSGGTTKDNKKNIDRHKDIFHMSKRLVDVLGFKADDRSLHLTSMHHGASLVYHYLPSLMACDSNYFYREQPIANQRSVDITVNDKITKICLYKTDSLVKFIDLLPKIDHNLDLYTLFWITESTVKIMKDKNINSITSLFGDTHYGLGFLINQVHQSVNIDTYNPRAFECPDDFYQLEVREDGRLWIKTDVLSKEWYTSDDLFERQGDKWIFNGRSSKFRINYTWIDFEELDAASNRFFGPQDATVSIDLENQKIYLAIWKDNAQAERDFFEFFKEKYPSLEFPFVLRNHHRSHFLNGRKVDRSRIKYRCRELFVCAKEEK